MDICSKVISMERYGASCLIHTDAPDIMLTFLTDEIIRLRASFRKEFAEESYALALTAWEDRLDFLFPNDRTRIPPVNPVVEESDDALVFATSSLRLVLEKDPFCIRLFDKEGTEVYASLAGNSFTLDANRRITHYSRMEEDDCFYGFGEKGGNLNKNRETVVQRATDAFGYDPRRTDTLYKHIPFYLQLRRKTGKAVGLFYHNFHESVFNLGREKSNYWPLYTTWRADGGDIDLFLLGGNSIQTILDHYTLLTGRPALLPKRALGYQGSSMYYAELPENSDAAVLSFVDNVREEGFPLDGFHLSSGYTSVAGKRCCFTWNRERFPNPDRFFAAMQEKGAPVVPNVKPGVLLCHPRFEEWKTQNVFVKDSKNPTLPAVGRWWGGQGVFWDFTDPQARKLWKALLKEALLSHGTDSVWNDNCEYDSLLDQDSSVSFDGKGSTIGALKPLMSNLMCFLSSEAIRELHPGARPYIVCRSGGSGIQHYAQNWCGDNYTCWETLQYNIPMITGMGLSGQPNDGADIGGFAGPAPEEELFVRWVQNGIFQPRFSIHSANNDNSVTEPWMYSRVTPIIREAIRFRYRLTPYLYSAEYEASQTGMPIMRALVCEFQDDPNVYDESFTFLFGRDLLVANVLVKGAKTKTVYLPAGCKWYDWQNSFRCYEGGQTIEVSVTLESIPLFLREGAILPLAENAIRNMERDPVTDLRLILAPGEDRSYTLYDDDGVSNDYQKNGFRKTHIRMSGQEVVTVAFTSEGEYRDTVETVTVEMICPARCPYGVMLRREKLAHYLNRRQFEAAETGWYYSQTKKAVLIKYPNPKRDYTLTVSFEDFDLIGI
ncbi:MAG: DUF4968 domain-containing protein [Oscillospiraceae bacterium]|nr:DUF4968 domain-containing protein [Oscillospiraceae bacterium]